MSDYKMVPVVATDEMRATFRGDREATTFFTHTTLQCADFDSRYRLMLSAAPPFVVTDEVVEKAAMAVERMVTADGYGWTDEQFNTWWNNDPLFCEHVNSWAGFTGTRKQKRIRETRAAIEAVLGGGA